GLGTFFVVAMVWLVLAAGGHDFFVRDIRWFMLGTALAAALVTGYVAGYVEDWRGAGVGLWNGLASWGVIIVLASMFVLPNFLRPLTRTRGATAFLRNLDFQMMVAVCCAFGGGLLLAGLAAGVGAASRRPNSLFKISADAERQFLEDLDATSNPRPIGVGDIG
ncbi:MAG TPA: hypothetical protein VGJ82_14605, partial [Thermoanaerobaculia bacterium]